MIRVYKTCCKSISKGNNFVRNKYYYAVKNNSGVKVFDDIAKKFIQFELNPPRGKNNFNAYFSSLLFFADYKNKKELNDFFMKEGQ